MRIGRKKPGEDGPKVPAWVVSFTDMITLLLAFFVLLQAFATVRDPELFFIGQGSFRRAIAGLGIPDLLFGKRDRPDYEYRKKRHPTEPDKNRRSRARVLNAEDEKIRKIFADLRRTLETKASDASQQPINVIPTPIRFSRGRAEPDEAAREYLASLAVRLGQGLKSEGIRVYVIGLAADVEDMRQQWLLSSQRARAAAELLRQGLSAQSQGTEWQIDAWGAGRGQEWRERFGLIPEQSYVLVAVTGAGDQDGG